MNRRYYVYLLHETPIEPPYYCKIGYTHNPLRRLAQLQAGNPRWLRSTDYSRRPDGPFGFPVPSLDHACALEARMFDRFAQEGIIVPRDLSYRRPQSSRREWVTGLHPNTLEQIMLEEWNAYMQSHGLLPITGR